MRDDRPGRVPANTLFILKAVGLAGGLAALAGLLSAQTRVWPGLLVAALWLVGVGLGGLMFVAIQYVSGAEWSVAFRRVPEAMTSTLLAGALLLLAVLVGHPALYPWMGKLAPDPEGTLWFRHWWLAQPFFLIRSVIYLATWLAFAVAIVRRSRRQDRSGEVALTRENAGLSAAGLVACGITLWLASCDWVQSLEPEWYSTIFGVYHFSGIMTGGLAVIVLCTVWLHRQGILRAAPTEQHLLDLGRLLFAFCTFWMYIWFSQYMLIWYANIPEETVYFVRRLNDGWGAVFLANMLLNWAIPFLVLLPQRCKQSWRILSAVAGVVLLGRFVDLYQMVYPPVVAGPPGIGGWEIAIWLGALAIAALAILVTIGSAAIHPVKDPSFAKSLQYQQ
jgi:hypothetical protein